MLVRFALTFALVALAGCGDSQPPAPGPQGTYDRHCAECHAQAGEPGGPGVGGSRGPNLSKIAERPGRTAEWLAEYIRDPKTAKPGAKLMPAFGDKLSAAQIKELAEWLAAKK
jgi:mono/diheme cytochrome c family protein